MNFKDLTSDGIFGKKYLTSDYEASLLNLKDGFGGKPNPALFASFDENKIEIKNNLEINNHQPSTGIDDSASILNSPGGFIRALRSVGNSALNFMPSIGEYVMFATFGLIAVGSRLIDLIEMPMISLLPCTLPGAFIGANGGMMLGGSHWARWTRKISSCPLARLWRTPQRMPCASS
ncbi:hypothetical protein GTU79_00510 [Sodalis ligni]|uniref:hypothetical protein n=1 Tax=Sodalis ligni TaxID=2697027 RepID=UPI001BDF4425|nr:hypothetical protein [Sodalis ligni]QWA11360.1 hypothetical protein GTU79_00510 [Sodalis ligni]